MRPQRALHHHRSPFPAKRRRARTQRGRILRVVSERPCDLAQRRHLRGNQLVAHGTGDDNVHYQHTEQLINALVAAGKQFQMMAYPNRTHGIFEGPGTAQHLYTLLTRYLAELLPAGGR